MKFSLPILIVLPVCFLACNKVDYQPVPQETVRSISHLGAYSSQTEQDEKDVEGTLFQTEWKLYWKRQGSGWIVQRRLDSLFARGYHKNSMPNELEKKADLDMELGADGIPVKIRGYDSLHSILSRLDQNESYRQQLLRTSDTIRFQAVQRDAFRLLGLLPRGTLERGMSLDVNGINTRLETVKLDSARYVGEMPRVKLRCLDYKAYYHRTDSMSLLVEQFFFSTARNRRWKRSAWSPGTVEGIWHLSVERATGQPCFESLTEKGRVTLHDSEDKSELPVTLYRYEEDLYH